MVEFQVLRCAKCKTFQVMQVTKSSKWKCKLCAEKQSLIKSYGRGTGADCRRHVQKLNTLQGQIDDTIEENCLVPPCTVSNNVKSDDNHEENNTNFKCLKESRWSHFMEGAQDEAEPDGGSMHCQHLALSTPDVSDFYKRNKRKRFQKRDGSTEKSANKFQEISGEHVGIDGLKMCSSVQWKHSKDHPCLSPSISQTHHAGARSPGLRWARSAFETNTVVKSRESPPPLSNIGRSSCFNSTRLMTLQGSSLQGQVDLDDHDPDLDDSHPANTDSAMVRSNQFKGQRDNQATFKNETITKQKKQRNLTEKVSKKWAAYVDSDQSEEDDDDDDFGKADEGGFYSIVATSRSDLNNAAVTALPAGEMNHVSTGTWQDRVKQSAGGTIQHFTYEPVHNLMASTSGVIHQEGDCKSEGVNFDLGYDDCDGLDL